MRGRTSGEAFRASSAISAAGWLFADLLLVLAMLFFAANTMGIHPPPTPTPPAPTTVSPKRPVLEHNYCDIVLNDNDSDMFRNQLPFAIETLEPQINSQSFLHGRQVGLAIAWGGVDDMNNPVDRDLGISLATQTYRVLDDLAHKSSVFEVASHFDPLFTQLHGSGNVVIDV